MVNSVTTDHIALRHSNGGVSAHLQQGKVSQLVDVDDEHGGDVMVTGRRAQLNRGGVFC